VAETGERVYELVDAVKKVERLQVILWGGGGNTFQLKGNEVYVSTTK
jgi:hypothetical protein